MRLPKRKETTHGLLTLVLLMGSFQLIFIYSNIASSKRPDIQHLYKESGSVYRKPVTVVNRDAVHRKATVTYMHTEMLRTKDDLNNGTPRYVTKVSTVHLNALGRADGLIPPLRVSASRFLPPEHDPLIYGYRRPNKGFLTIGIPSIKRANTGIIYLYQTLESLINNTSADDKREITVVILLSDLNRTYNDEIAREVYYKFEIFCREGFLRIIKAPITMYPNFDMLKSTLHDKIERVKWRAKQNIDFAYLCLYSKNISDYYIQLEDDVLSARNFSTYIRSQINNVTKSWFMLEFSRLGFIGKLFRDEDIVMVAEFLLFHFEKKPGDLMLGKMLSLKGQNSPIHSAYSLFQHNGKFSSLENKMMPSIDSYFKDADKLILPIMSLPKGNNPPAKLVTSFEAVPGYFPSYAYDGNSSTFFWAKTPTRFDHFSVLFEKPHDFKRIIISTGDPKRKKDSLLNSMLFVAVKRNTQMRKGRCGVFVRLAEFVDGEIDTKAMGISVPSSVVCLRIYLKSTSKTWVILRDIILI